MTVVISCVDLDREDPADMQRLVNEGLKIRLADFKQKEWAKCLEEARQRAISEADSIIRARARLEAIQPVPKPPKPNRPDKPMTKTVPDSLRADTLRTKK